MEKDRTIVYLGTENNPKSCLALEDILENGWNIKLVIAYSPPKVIQKQTSIFHRVKSKLTQFIRSNQFIYTIARKLLKKPIKLEFKNMEVLCNLYSIQYNKTTDKTLQTLKNQIEDLSPDVILSNGWMFKITDDIFSLANIITLNCHSSYLPEYRGGNVTYAPLINEEKQSGVTVHQLVDKFDAGLILAQERVTIDHNETPDSLNTKRAQITGCVICKALEVAGNKELYKPNPPSPFYFRCGYKTYKRYKRVNYLRKLLGLDIKRYEPKQRYDI